MGCAPIFTIAIAIPITPIEKNRILNRLINNSCERIIRDVSFIGWVRVRNRADFQISSIPISKISLEISDAQQI